MVKNVKGGTGHKSQARKHVITKETAKTRLASDEYEYYGYVTSILGGSNCHVVCQDGVKRLCIIRGKFRGSRGKRDSYINKGTWVLVGIREWATESSKSDVLDKCDLLEVYNDNDKYKLKTIPDIDWSKFIINEQEIGTKSSAKGVTNNYDDVIFSNDIGEEEYKKLVEDINNKKSGKIELLTSVKEKEKKDEEDMDENEYINIDDI
jgi:translation initiation factor 1A